MPSSLTTHPTKIWGRDRGGWSPRATKVWGRDGSSMGVKYTSSLLWAIPSSLTTHPTKIWGRDRGGTCRLTIHEILMHTSGTEQPSCGCRCEVVCI